VREIEVILNFEFLIRHRRINVELRNPQEAVGRGFVKVFLLFLFISFAGKMRI
jgi:hypothetical protein